MNAEGAFVISAPETVQKTFEVKYDSAKKKIVGLPAEWEHLLQGFTQEEIADPELIPCIVHFQQQQMPRETDFMAELG